MQAGDFPHQRKSQTYAAILAAAGFIYTKKGLDDAALERFMQREAKLFLDDGAMFGPGGSGFARINLACPAWVLQKALTRLEQAVKRNF